MFESHWNLNGSNYTVPWLPLTTNATNLIAITSQGHSKSCPFVQSAFIDLFATLTCFSLTFQLFI